ncbi:pentatricopeptide repeat-containing protein At2g13600 [Selaginella moellendorffii]|uniref:pentatricopeptide repeat-containing protein At2g13600 n=1 Tax=Selaginella moellendorffii TaxID=88036 RepID=UPI000D1CF1C1|nr:pentatricopeptide repeat-containing protein At2g13600 [Selaginella moellendorffii]|eukprot:XP_024531925.1 pentatricopeptide repeat-containing protein At2g13600 [Selaginella moellendorffii]
MQVETCEIFATSLQSCGEIKDLARGRKIHAEILKSRHGGDRYLANRLVEMYGKCRSVEEARAVFDGILRKNVFSWTLMVTAYTRNGYSTPALELVKQMVSESVKLDRIALLRIVEACDQPDALDQARELHTRFFPGAAAAGDVVVATALVNMYGRCGSVSDAKTVFDEMQHRNITSWNAMLVTYSLNQRSLEALRFFRTMLLEGVRPDSFTFLKSLDVCSKLGEPALVHGELLHACSVQSQDKPDVLVSTSTINMFAKCGTFQDAYRVFEEMEEKSPASWSTIISASVTHGFDRDALQLFFQMQQQGTKPDSFTAVALLISCSNLLALEHRRVLHLISSEEGWIESDVVLGTSLVNMYSKCGSLYEAEEVFKRMPTKDKISWTAMVTAYAQNGRSEQASKLLQEMQQQEHLDPEKFAWTAVISGHVQEGKAGEALEFFRRMEQEGVKPDAITFVSAADACGMMGDLSRAVEIHSRISQSWPSNQTDVVLGSALIKMYGNCRSLAGAAQVLDEMPRTNVISWTSMILACEQNEDNEAAIHVYRAMQLHGHKPDPVTMVTVIKAAANLHDLKRGIEFHAQAAAFGFATSTVVGNALVTLYGTSGDLQAAENVFKELLQQSVEDVVTWNSMLSAWNQNGLPNQALRTFQRMLHHGRHPDKTTFVNILNACAGDPSKLLQAVKIHALAAACGLDSDTDVANTLLHMYSRCGNLSRARKVFHAITQKNVVSWSAMAAACAHNGDADGALQAFRGMLHGGIQPNAVTFISILSGCSHTGLMDEAVSYLYAMSSDHNLKPTVQHYACLLDLLARAGKFHRAEELATHLPNPVAWNSLLGACLVHGDAETAARAADTAAKLQPLDCAPYVSLSNAMSTGKNLKTKLNYFQ